MSMTEASIPAVLADRAERQPDDVAYTFVDYEADPAGVAESLTWSEVYERVQVVAEKLAGLGSPGDRAVILAPQSLEYIVGFVGAIQAGFIAVPLSMPQTRHHDERVTGAMKDSTPVVVLTTSAVVDDIRKYGQADPTQRPPKFLEVDTLDFDTPPRSTAQPTLLKTAYLQYTSGSTRSPAGVVVTHRNVVVNLGQLLTDYYEAYPDGAPEDTTVVSWLPFYHDMGLIVGVFIPMVLGRPAVLMSPVAFMQKPSRWMQQLGSHPSAFTAAPNFAFELAVKRTSDEDLAGKDLSTVKVMINGAERVHGSTVRRFNQRFAQFGLSDSAMRPSYGLAEATVYVAASAGGQPPTAVRFDYEKLAAGHAEIPPLFISVDQEGGRVARLGKPFTQFPPMSCLGQADSVELAYRFGLGMGKELRAVGINMDYAPVLDVHSNPENPIIGLRALDTDPAKVARLGAELIRGFYDAGVIPVGKHFPGHGDTSQDSHLALPQVERTRESLEQIELVPFIRAIQQGLQVIMTAHVVYPACFARQPATFSYSI
ncbi:glycoside hydrolase family 3 N-terminal domain-containing protein [Mycolicibacterium poriferae]|uniref:glycoside hydrolase family 3 N-terminal domain-containing protein n=1 Tax=Mycolicibacterium poriferae TaxID=39694 RepID=UPI0032190D69